MDTETQVQILDETGCISHSTNKLGKGMNPIIQSSKHKIMQGKHHHYSQKLASSDFFLFPDLNNLKNWIRGYGQI